MIFVDLRPVLGLISSSQVGFIAEVSIKDEAIAFAELPVNEMEPVQLQ
jgi:hypothetical protein